MRTFKTAALAATLAFGLAACGGAPAEETSSLAGASSPYAEQQAAIDLQHTDRARRAIAQAKTGKSYSPTTEERDARLAAEGW